MSSVRTSRFDLTDAERSFPAPPLDPEGFKTALLKIRPDLIGYFVRAYVRDRVPSAFSDRAMLWEAIRQWMARRISSSSGIQISPFEIGLTGSANLGFSPVPRKYGTPYGKHSDLDLFIANEQLFELVQLDASRFVITEDPKFYDQRRTVRDQIVRGLADTHNFPASHDDYPTTAMLLNETSIVIQKLNVEGVPSKRSHIRVYRSWADLARQMQLNFGLLRGKLREAP